MKKRQVEIVQDILAEKKPIDLQSLMNKYDRSERSLRYDILEIRNELDNFGIHLQNKSGQGYYIPEEQKPECLSLLNSGRLLDETHENNDLALACFALLYRCGTYRTLEQLAGETGGSRGTITRALRKFNDSNNGVRFETSRRGVILTGDEYILRDLAMQESGLILKEDQQRTAEKASDALKKTNTHFDLWLTTQAYQDLKLFCEITLARAKCTGTTYDKKYIEHDENVYAAYLLEKLGIDRSEKQLAVLTRRMIKNNVIVSLDQQQPSVRTRQLVERLVQESEKSGIEVDEEKLVSDLTTHLRSLAKCLSYGIEFPQNPMLMNIKTNYRTYFEIAKRASSGWHIYQNQELNESEIAYVAIYLYKDSVHTENHHWKALVICATGKGLSNLIAAKISDRFPELEIIGVESAYRAESRAAEADFVISTLPLANMPRPVIVVSGVLNEQDMNRIQMFLKGETGERNNGALKQQYLPAESVDRQEMLRASRAMTSILLALTDLFSTLPSRLQLDTDHMLAMLMHLYLAVPRWCQGDIPANESASKKKIAQYEKKDPELAKLMNTFFSRTEEVLGFKLYAGEKIAFYLYIVNERNSI